MGWPVRWRAAAMARWWTASGLGAGMPRPWRPKALRSDGQVVPSCWAAALTLPSCSARAKARSASARSERNRLGCQPTCPLAGIRFDGPGRLVGASRALARRACWYVWVPVPTSRPRCHLPTRGPDRREVGSVPAWRAIPGLLYLCRVDSVRWLGCWRGKRWVHGRAPSGSRRPRLAWWSGWLPSRRPPARRARSSARFMISRAPPTSPPSLMRIWSPDTRTVDDYGSSSSGACAWSGSSPGCRQRTCGCPPGPRPAGRRGPGGRGGAVGRLTGPW
jgi:hypothetical protein